jgi:hypothetical protein
MPYKHSNGRIQHRGNGGRFRHSTLADIGLGCCDKCGKFFAPNYSGLGDMPNPLLMRERQATCGECLGLPPVVPVEEPRQTLQGLIEISVRNCQNPAPANG